MTGSVSFFNLPARPRTGGAWTIAAGHLPPWRSGGEWLWQRCLFGTQWTPRSSPSARPQTTSGPVGPSSAPPRQLAQWVVRRRVGSLRCTSSSQLKLTYMPSQQHQPQQQQQHQDKHTNKDNRYWATIVWQIFGRAEARDGETRAETRTDARSSAKAYSGTHARANSRDCSGTDARPNARAYTGTNARANARACFGIGARANTGADTRTDARSTAKAHSFSPKPLTIGPTMAPWRPLGDPWDFVVGFLLF